MLTSAAFLLLSSFVLSAIAGHPSHNNLRARHARQAHRRDKSFTLTDKYVGKDFLDEGKWGYFTGSDPTHGSVNFVSQSDAVKKGLAFVRPDNVAVLAVDNTTDLSPGQNRNTIRITSTKSYNGGLFIADFGAMPHGCSVWPAWWSVGPNWPSAGEIDVIEGVNEGTVNQYTLHTGEGCNLARNPPASSTGSLAFTSKVLGTTCASSGGDNSGCAFLDSDTRSFGHGFNEQGGGVYAHLWDNTGIKAWHFARGEIPADITAGAPNPDSWPTPQAFWAASGCDIAQHFHDHNLVIDTTLCGDFAGGAYPQSGCPGTCAQAVADKTNFDFARWQINSISVYN
ncbi:glycoside hydrolase family 16 protein [Auriscalpium vulgare]|uniref:Glycoside hydrolase family 16 protein n=1 Tax=Auriscalpium vulgare TaxID=40419 RepID=A0ACB8RAQ3_9AGAM|nr:glycoside hydrolase family 16 protein [Auriscalpium vulgare]